MTTNDSTILATTAADLASMSTHYYAAYGTQTWSIAAPPTATCTPVDDNSEALPDWLAQQRRDQARDIVIGLLTGIIAPIAMASFANRYAGGRYGHWVPTLVLLPLYAPLLLGGLAFVFDFPHFEFRSMTCWSPDPQPEICEFTDLRDWLKKFFSSGNVEGFRWYWPIFFVIGVLALWLIGWTWTHLPTAVREGEIAGAKRKRREEKLKVVHKEAHQLGMEILDARKEASIMEKGEEGMNNSGGEDEGGSEDDSKVSTRYG